MQAPQTTPDSPRPERRATGTAARSRASSPRAVLTRTLLRPRLPTKIALAAALAAGAYWSFRGFSETYAHDGSPEMRPVYGALFAACVFACGFVGSRRPPRRFD
jgi:hypothetical protein